MVVKRDYRTGCCLDGKEDFFFGAEVLSTFSVTKKHGAPNALLKRCKKCHVSFKCRDLTQDDSTRNVSPLDEICRYSHSFTVAQPII